MSALALSERSPAVQVEAASVEDRQEQRALNVVELVMEEGLTLAAHVGRRVRSQVGREFQLAVDEFFMGCNDLRTVLRNARQNPQGLLTIPRMMGVLQNVLLNFENLVQRASRYTRNGVRALPAYVYTTIHTLHEHFKLIGDVVRPLTDGLAVQLGIETVHNKVTALLNRGKHRFHDESRPSFAMATIKTDPEDQASTEGAANSALLLGQSSEQVFGSEQAIGTEAPSPVSEDKITPHLDLVEAALVESSSKIAGDSGLEELCEDLSALQGDVSHLKALRNRAFCDELFLSEEEPESCILYNEILKNLAMILRRIVKITETDGIDEIQLFKEQEPLPQTFRLLARVFFDHLWPLCIFMPSVRRPVISAPAAAVHMRRSIRSREEELKEVRLRFSSDTNSPPAIHVFARRGGRFEPWLALKTSLDIAPDLTFELRLHPEEDEPTSIERLPVSEDSVTSVSAIIHQGRASVSHGILQEPERRQHTPPDESGTVTPFSATPSFPAAPSLAAPNPPVAPPSQLPRFNINPPSPSRGIWRGWKWLLGGTAATGFLGGALLCAGLFLKPQKLEPTVELTPSHFSPTPPAPEPEVVSPPRFQVQEDHPTSLWHAIRGVVQRECRGLSPQQVEQETAGLVRTTLHTHSAELKGLTRNLQDRDPEWKILQGIQADEATYGHTLGNYPEVLSHARQWELTGAHNMDTEISVWANTSLSQYACPAAA